MRINKNFNSYMRTYTTIAVCMFLSFSLIVSSGFTYGPVLLLLGSLTLAFKRPELSMAREDWIIIATLAAYFLIGVLSNFFHHLPAKAYDNFSRFLIAIPVLFLLIAYPPKSFFFLFGGGVGAFLAGLLAVWQVNHDSLIRASGYMNPIQFGDICVLLIAVTLLGCFWAISVKNYILITFFAFSLLLGLIGCFLSGARGGWIAIPVMLFFTFKYLQLSVNKRMLHYVLVLMMIFIPSVYLLSKTIFYSRSLQSFSEVKAIINGRVEVDSTVNSRIEMWGIGFKSFLKYPILGAGDLENIRKEFPADVVKIVGFSEFNHLHNEYIDALAKRGLLGFFSLLSIYLIPLFLFCRNIKHQDLGGRIQALMGVLLIICSMIFGLTQVFLAHASGTMMYVFLLVIIWAQYRNVLDGTSHFSDVKCSP